MAKVRSVVQAYHEEMRAIFQVLKAARTVVNSHRASDQRELISNLNQLAWDLDELDELRSSQKQEGDS